MELKKMKKGVSIERYISEDDWERLEPRIQKMSDEMEKIKKI